MLFASTIFKLENDPFYLAGIAAGKIKGLKKTALELKRRGTDLTFIAEVTQLSIEEIERL